MPRFWLSAEGSNLACSSGESGANRASGLFAKLRASRLKLIGAVQHGDQAYRSNPLVRRRLRRTTGSLQMRRASGVSPISSAQAATYQALRMNMVASSSGFSVSGHPEQIADKRLGPHLGWEAICSRPLYLMLQNIYRCAMETEVPTTRRVPPRTGLTRHLNDPAMPELSPNRSPSGIPGYSRHRPRPTPVWPNPDVSQTSS